MIKDIDIVALLDERIRKIVAEELQNFHVEVHVPAQLQEKITNQVLSKVLDLLERTKK